MPKHAELKDDEKRFIDEVIGPQLQRSQTVKLTTNGGSTLRVNYCMMNNGDPASFMRVILLITGFGSGWTGIAKLGYDLTKLGHQVCMISMPGYGNSDDPFLPCYLIKAKRNDVEILEKFIKKILPGREIHLVGHSMGAEIITRFAFSYPQQVASLTLLNPAGFEKRKPLEIALKFASNGIRHSIAFRDDPVWAELKKFLPKEKSPFALNRLKQRVNEWRHICAGLALDTFEKISSKIPVKYISSKKDSIFPWHQSSVYLKCLVRKHSHVCVLSDLWHNTTMFGSEKTAEIINGFLINSE